MATAEQLKRQKDALTRAIKPATTQKQAEANMYRASLLEKLNNPTVTTTKTGDKPTLGGLEGRPDTSTIPADANVYRVDQTTTATTPYYYGQSGSSLGGKTVKDPTTGKVYRADSSKGQALVEQYGFTDAPVEPTAPATYAEIGEANLAAEANTLNQFGYDLGLEADQFLTPLEEAKRQIQIQREAKLAQEAQLKEQEDQMNYDANKSGASIASALETSTAQLTGSREGVTSSSNLSAAEKLKEATQLQLDRLTASRTASQSALDQARVQLAEAERSGNQAIIQNARNALLAAEQDAMATETAYITALNNKKETSSFDNDLTNLINDGYLYKMDEKGVPTRVLDAQGQPIVVDKEESTSTLDFTPPKQDAFGNIVSPGYMFDKKTGELTIVDPSTGEYTSYTSGQEAYQAAANFSNFDQYIAQTGTGNVIAGSPYHKGLEMDIDGEIGDPVLAFTTGTVESVENTCTTADKSCGGGYGNNVVVKMADGSSVRYAHLNSVNLSVGQQLYAGNLIGELGNTGQVIPLGNGDGSHLHIEARNPDGTLKDLSTLEIGSTMTFKAGEDLNSLRAEAFAAGYITDAEVMGYINAKKYGITPPNRTETEMTDSDFNKSNTFRDEFNSLPTVKDFKTIRDNAKMVKGLIDMGTSGAGDIAIIYSFMRALDPTSVVREAEFATGQYKGGNIFSGAFAKFQGLFNEQGGFISDSAKKEFLSSLSSLYKTKQQSFQSELDRYSRLAEKFDLDPEFIIYDYSEGIEDVLNPDVTPSYTLTDVAKSDIDAGVLTQEDVQWLYENNPDALIELGYITNY